MWLHAASIGESLALLPLIERLRTNDLLILLTTGTRSSARIVMTRLPSGALHQYVPLDTPAAVRAFLDHWQPALLVLAESEIWPNMLHACAVRMIPVALVNGRLSERSSANWARVPDAARTLFGGLSLCLAQSAGHAARLVSLGAKGVVVTGSLKHDRAPPPADVQVLAALRTAIGARFVVVAAVTHPGDEAIVLAAHREIRARHRDLLTILVPRDVTRGSNIAAHANRAGFATAIRSRADAIDAGTEVLVADTLGEMGLWLRLATIAVIGKTFGGRRGAGGQTPIEAAQCAAAIVHGPSTEHFADVFAALDACGGARESTASALAETLAALLDDPLRRRAMISAAAATVAAMAGATTRTHAALVPLLAQARRA